MKIRKKTTATLLIAIFMISAFAIAIPVSAQEDFVVVETELENVFFEIAPKIEPTATVALSTDEANSGIQSVKITTFETASGWSDWGGVEIRLDVPIALKDISTLSFWQKLSTISGDSLELDTACVVLYIDYDEDGKFEYTNEDVKLLGANNLEDGDTTEWEEFDATTRGWWTGYLGGIGAIDYMLTTTFDTWQNEPAINEMMVMSVVIGYCNLAQTLYIDDIEINGDTYDFEPDAATSIMGFGVEPSVSISVLPTEVDFGNIILGETTVFPQALVITNGPETKTFVTAELIDDDGFYSASLRYDGIPIGTWDTTILKNGEYSASLSLVVDRYAETGLHTATLVFWAEAVTPP